MLSKRLLKQALIMLGITGFAISPAFLFYFTQHSFNLPSYDKIYNASAILLTGQMIENNIVLSNQERIISNLPVRLKIPEINVDAAVEYVGRTPGGAMDVPKNQKNVAWFHPGPSPGENGSAVIAGHYGRKNKQASVFDNLYKLRKGDKLYVQNNKGETVTFVVRKSQRYDPDADASDVFGSSDGKAHLNLVTCEGAWDEASQSYSHRLVIFADKEIE